jgi:hypothetical protein
MKLDKSENNYIQEDKKQIMKQVSYLLRIKKIIKVFIITLAVVGWIIISGLIAIIILLFRL